MTTIAQLPGMPLRVVLRADSWAGELLSVFVGLLFTAALFGGLTRIAHRGAADPKPVIEDLRALAVPLEPPPPRRIDDDARVEDPVANVTNLDLGPSESPVKIAIVPPDLAALFPPEPERPAAEIETGRFYADLKPHAEAGNDSEQRVYQESQVDQPPDVAYRTAPMISQGVRKGADMLRVVLLLTIDQQGAVTSLHVLKSSGSSQFDEIVGRCVREEWVFTPAVKAGKHVRCLVQQSIRVVWNNDSPFTL